MRCGTPGTSGHVTRKSSIREVGVLYKSGVYALKALCLTPGGLYSVLTEGMAEILWHRRETRWKRRRQSSAWSRRNRLRHEQSCLIAVQESAEGILGEETQTAGKACMDELGTRPAYRKSR